MLLGWLPHVLLVVGMVAQAASVYAFARDGWFGFDGLHYLVYRGQLPEADLGLLQPWGGHWQLVPFLLYRALFATFGWSYAGYLAVAIGLHLAVTVASYAVLLRVGASRAVAFVAAWLLLFFGTGAEVFTSDAPIPLTLALVLVLAAVWLLASRVVTRPRVVAAAALLLLAVMTSAVGVIGLVLVAGFTIGSGRWRRALVVVPAALAFTTWYVTVGNDSPRIHLENWDATDIPAFVWRAMTQSLAGSVGVPESGAVLLLLLLGGMLFLHGASHELRALAWAGWAAAGAELVASALASLAFIEGSTIPSRYLYVAFALMLPALALVLDGAGRLVARRETSRAGLVWPAVIALALLVSATVVGLQQERESAAFATALAKPTRQWVYGTAAAVDDGERILDAEPPVTFGEAMDMNLVAELALRAPLPEWPGEEAQARLVAENNFFVTVGAEDPQLFHPIFINGTGFTQQFRPRPGCHSYTALGLSDPVLRFSTGQENAIGVTSDSTTVTTRVVRGDVEGPQRTWQVEPGPLYIGSTAKDAVVEVSFDGDGDYSVCHQ